MLVFCVIRHRSNRGLTHGKVGLAADIQQKTRHRGDIRLPTWALALPCWSVSLMTHSHCTGPGPGTGTGQGTGCSVHIAPGPGQGQGMMALYIMLFTVHITQGQGMGQGGGIISVLLRYCKWQFHSQVSIGHCWIQVGQGRALFSVQFVLLSCSFWSKIGQIIKLAPLSEIL